MSKLNWWKTVCVVCLLCTATAITAPAQTFTTLFNFDYAYGATPVAGLIQGTDGDLYGTTTEGGAGGTGNGGTAFRITPSGTLATLHSFCMQSGCPDGYYPFGGIIQATDGNFYGTTEFGGTLGGNGWGTVFKITPSGILTTLYSFCSESECADGMYPQAGLVQAADGNLYGTTSGNGCGSLCGTIFRITPPGSLTTLYTFCHQAACADGEHPSAMLIQATDGNLYGTTLGGGVYGGGTVFKIALSGELTTLYSFCSQKNCTDGSQPTSTLVQSGDGTFYGTTVVGGSSVGVGCGLGCGTVFNIAPSGMLKTLHRFCSRGDCTDGEGPAGLVFGSDDNLYGTTGGGGGNDYGTAFMMSPSGTLTTLFSFDYAGGDGPSRLLEDTSGTFYGTAYAGGTGGECLNGCGAVFGLSIGLGPFVETQPPGGKVGDAIKILGTDLTGATSVTFNGTPATFTVEASSVIKATVPAGATTGTVQVVTPSGTLSSNAPFRVAP